jgi:hypothetical protein
LIQKIQYIAFHILTFGLFWLYANIQNHGGVEGSMRRLVEWGKRTFPLLDRLFSRRQQFSEKIDELLAANRAPAPRLLAPLPPLYNTPLSPLLGPTLRRSIQESLQDLPSAITHRFSRRNQRSPTDLRIHALYSKWHQLERLTVDRYGAWGLAEPDAFVQAPPAHVDLRLKTVFALAAVALSEWRLTCPDQSEIPMDSTTALAIFNAFHVYHLIRGRQVSGDNQVVLEQTGSRRLVFDDWHTSLYFYGETYQYTWLSLHNELVKAIGRSMPYWEEGIDDGGSYLMRHFGPSDSSRGLLGLA